MGESELSRLYQRVFFSERDEERARDEGEYIVTCGTLMSTHTINILESRRVYEHAEDTPHVRVKYPKNYIPIHRTENNTNFTLSGKRGEKHLSAEP